MNKYEKKNKWDDIKDDMEAIEFHASRFLLGYRDTLAVLSYQFLQQKEREIAQKDR